MDLFGASAPVLAPRKNDFKGEKCTICAMRDTGLSRPEISLDRGRLQGKQGATYGRAFRILDPAALFS